MNAKIFIAIVAAVVLLSVAAASISEETDAATYNYSLSFDANGGTGAPNTLTFGPTTETSHNFSIPSTEPSNGDYYFGGWATSSGGPGIYNPGDIITLTSSQPSVTLYASWESIQQETTYYLIFNDNGGSGGPGQLSYGPTTDTTHLFTIPNTVPQREGYDFAGWSVNRFGTGTIYNPGETINLGDTGTQHTTFTLYAIWDESGFTFTLQFEANGGSGAPDSLTYGPSQFTSHIFTIPDETPTRSDYVFMGWWTDPNGDEIDLFYQPGDSITVTYSPNTVTLYAQWGYAQTTTYIIYFDANGGSGAPATINSGPVSATSYRVTIPSTVPTWSGHTFLGWSFDQNDTAGTYQPGGHFTLLPTGGTYSDTLYAIWATEFTYTIQFVVNNGTGAPSNLTYGPTTATSHQFTLPDDVPTHSDPSTYKFAGWSNYPSGQAPLYQPGGSVTVSAGDDTNVTRTLYASWTQIAYTFTLEFVAPEATNVPGTLNSPTVSTDHFMFVIPNNIPQREGYEFSGWVVGASSTGTVYQPGDTITVTDEYTFMTAVWDGVEYEYRVNFDANGGFGAPNPLYYRTSNSSHTFTLPDTYPSNPSNPDLVFAGWALSSGGSAQYLPGGTVTLYAPDNITITLFAAWVDGGATSISLSGPSTVEVGNMITITATVSGSESAGVTWTITTGEGLVETPSTTATRWQAEASATGQLVVTATADDGSGATSSFTVTIIAGGMVLPTSISMTGPGSVEPGTIGQIYANIIPTNAVNRGVIWTVTEGGNLITYTTDSTFRGGVLEFTARYAGTVTVTATSTADNSIVGTYTLTILAGTVDEDNQTVSLGGITGMLSGLFDGNTDIAGIVIYAIILMIIFLLIREPLPVLVISIPMTLIFTALGIVGTDFMILLIIIATLGLALIARNMWRD